ncbi:MAG: hypothetical protein WCK10_02305 [Candidatus Staskawiczbacteria bacterium]
MDNTNQNQTEAPKEEPKVAPKGASKNTGMAVLAYIIFFVPLLTDAKNDPFVKYHVKQGLVLFLAAVICNFVPIIGQIVSLALVVLMVMGIMNAVNGKQEPLPLIGQFADKFKF